MARKPLSEKTVAENCLKWKTGGINIDESRVGHLSVKDKLGTKLHITNVSSSTYSQIKPSTIENEGNPIGRFPANLIHDGSEEVRKCFPEVKYECRND